MTVILLNKTQAMKFSETEKGDLNIIFQAIMWSAFPIITILSFKNLAPIASLAYSSVFLVISFGILIVVRGKTREIFIPAIWKYIPLVTLFITIFYYGLYYTGLKYTTAGNASIVALTEIFFSYLLFNVWKKEFFSAAHTIGAVLMLVGTIIILYPKQGVNFHAGDFFILIAAMSAPLGNFYQQKLRKLISSETLVFLRSLLAIPVFFALAFALKASVPLATVQKSFWFLAFNGIIILGVSKYMWMEGIHRMSVTKANALSSIAPLFTLLFAFWFFGQVPTARQLLAFIPMALGLVLLTYNKNFPKIFPKIL